VCAFVAVGLLAVELYWFYQLTHPARASQVALPAWLDGLFSFIAGVVWLFLVMIIICAVVWGVMIVALVLDFHGDELGSEVGSMIHAGACCGASMEATGVRDGGLGPGRRRCLGRNARLGSRSAGLARRRAGRGGLRWTSGRADCAALLPARLASVECLPHMITDCRRRSSARQR
jgi:hypothetical protein